MPFSSGHSAIFNGSNDTHSSWIFHGPQDPPLFDWTTAKLLDVGAQVYGDRTAIVSCWQSTRWTYKDLRERSQRLATKLVRSGAHKGDKIVVLAGNCVEYIELFFAATAIGAIFVIINPTFTSKEALEAMDLVEPRFIFVARRIGFRNNDKLIRSLCSKGSGFSAPTVVYIGGLSDGFESAYSFREFLEKFKGSEKTDIGEVWGCNSSSDVCCFQFTSGTTGPRKISMLSHSNIINNARFVGDRLELTKQDVLCCPPPLFHCFGLVCGLLATASHGSTLVLPSDVFNPAAIIQSFTQEKCTIVNAVPTMLQSLLNQEDSKSTAAEYSLRTGIIAGASLSKSLLDGLSDRFGLSSLLYPFGMTELSAVSFCTSSNHSLLSDWTTVGTLLPHTSAKVIGPSGETLPPGQPGELCVSGYLVHQGYYQAPDKSAEIVRTDERGRAWLHTGDTVTISPGGFCTVMGRTKDMIKKGGENIIPKDVEEILMGHPEISNAAVVGINDPKWGEEVVAFVQKSSTSQSVLSDKELKAWLRKHDLAPHKVPTYFLVLGQKPGIPEQLPINASGKVLKNELRVLAQGIVTE